MSIASLRTHAGQRLEFMLIVLTNSKARFKAIFDIFYFDIFTDYRITTEKIEIRDLFANLTILIRESV